MQIRPYDPSVDETRLLNLWEASFDNWPVIPAWFHTIALNSENLQEHLLAETGGQVVGFVLTQVTNSSPPRGSLLALGVHPNYRRQGVGRMLHQAALERLRMRGVQHVQLGSGGQDYFWPGVPVDLAGAWAFFQGLGWPEIERSYDLVRSLKDYETPAWVWERVRGLAVEFVTADQCKLDREIVDFVSAEQPGWAPYYAQALREQRAQDVLVAQQGGCGKIVGACLIENPAQRWALRFSQPLGAPGCILTAEAARGRGIGMALTARATEILQDRGCQTSFLGWTWLVDWYGKLGYQVWQENIMSWQDVGAFPEN